MMYDPAQALQAERDLLADQLLLANVEERCGAEDPWTQRVRLATDIMQTIAQKEDDLNNCFDYFRQKEIEASINELIGIAETAIR